MLGGEGLDGVGHLLGGLLLRSTDLHPGGLWKPGLAHGPTHGQLVASQLEGLRRGLDADALVLETLQKA